MSDDKITKAAVKYANNRRHAGNSLGRDGHREARLGFEAGAEWQAQRQGGEATAGMYGLSRSKLLTIVDELREAVLGMSDDVSPEAREEHLMDLTFHRYTQDDDGIQEGPFLCVNLSEYPEEGVYPIDQTGNAEARKTRVAQNAESDQQVDLSSVSDKQGGEAVAWRVSHPDKGWEVYQQYPAWAEADFVIQPLYATPQPQPAVPDQQLLENRHLAAQVERLREAGLEVAFYNSESAEYQKARFVIQGETPAQSLREVQAEAGRKGYIHGSTHITRMALYWHEIKAEADRYAQQIRSGEDE